MLVKLVKKGQTQKLIQVEKKLTVLQEHDGGASKSSLAKTHGIPPRNIRRMQKNRGKIEQAFQD